MRNLLMVVSLGICAASVLGQVTQPGVPGQQLSNPQVLQQFANRQGLSTPSSSLNVPLDAPVVTLEGVCDTQTHSPSTKKASPCKTTITRAQMESLMSLLSPGNSESSRAQFTVAYARLLAASAAADKQHLDKDPAVARELEMRLKFVRMQVLTEALYRKMQTTADNIDVAEMRKYYADHLSLFDEGEVQRISFPQSARTISGTPLDPARVKAEAEEIRKRAIAGEDFDLLQQMVIRDLGMNVPVLPVTKLEKARRSNLSFNQGKVFDLQPGEISEVMEAFDGLVILKLVSKHSPSFESVQADIREILRPERMRQQLQTASEKVKGEFSLTYLGTTTAPNLFPAPSVARISPSGRSSTDPRARAVARRRKPPVMPAPPATSSATPPGR